MVYGVSSISIPSIHFTVLNSGKMPVPVAPSTLMYSNFQYVSGIPAQDESHGVSISRLHLLNVLIGQLNKANLEPSFETLGNQFQDMDSLTGALLETVRSHILETRQTAMPYIPAPDAQIGLLFDLNT